MHRVWQVTRVIVLPCVIKRRRTVAVFVDMQTVKTSGLRVGGRRQTEYFNFYQSSAHNLIKICHSMQIRCFVIAAYVCVCGRHAFLKSIEESRAWCVIRMIIHNNMTIEFYFSICGQRHAVTYLIQPTAMGRE